MLWFQECRQAAQTQVSVFSQPREAQTADREAFEHVESQWGAAVWDASEAVHCKEAQLQLVTELDRQTQTVKATLEKLSAELEALTM